jgi:YD repeat-containing protein
VYYLNIAVKIGVLQMTSLTVAGYTISGMDSFTSVESAANDLSSDPTNNKLIIAYDAALANAAAALTAGKQGLGAAFAGNAIIANMNNFLANGATMTASDKASGLTSIIGELITLAGQGVTFVGLQEMEVNPLLGGETFTLGQLVNAAGFIATAIGAGIDSSTIASMVSQQMQAVGLVPNNAAVYVPSSFSSSNFVCDADNASTMFNIAVGNNSSEINASSVIDLNGVATVLVDSQDASIIISPGLSGPGLSFEIQGNNNQITAAGGAGASSGRYSIVGSGNSADISNSKITLAVQSSASLTGTNNTVVENAGSTVTLNSTDSNTIENAVTGQEFTISGGTIRASGDNGPFGGGATDSFTANNDGSMSLAISDSSGEQTDTDTFSSTGELTQDQQFSNGNLADEINYTSGVETSQVFYSALTGAETAEDIFNSDGSQSDSTFRGGIENISVYNADDQLIEQALIIPNATTTEDFYDPSSGVMTGEVMVNSDGSERDITINQDGSYSRAIFDASGQQTEHDQCNADGSATEDFYDPSSGVQTGENQINSDGSQTNYQFNSDGSQSASVYNAYGQQTEQAQFNADGSATKDFYNAAGQETEALDDFTNGTSQETFFTGLPSGESSETDAFTGADGTGTQTAALFDLTNGTSQELFYTGLSNGEASEDEFFSGTNATGTQTEDLYDFTNGTSQAQYFTGLGSGVSELIDDYMSANGTGTETSQVTDFTAGNSQVTTFTGLPSGESSETDAFSGANGTGTQTEALFNLTNGTSQDFFYNSSTGAETGETDINADGSQDQYTFNANGSQNMTAFNAAGQETEQAQFNADGSATENFYDPSTRAETGETDINADGSRDQYTFNANGSQNMTAFNAAGQETEQAQFNANGSATENFYDPSTRAETGETDINADGSQDQYTFNANGSQNMTAFNAAGQETEQAQFNANGSATEYFYNPSTRAESGETDINADGSQDQYTFNANGSQSMTAFNAAGQETEQAQFNANGSATENFYDPSTRVQTGENDINADGSQTDYSFLSNGSQTASVYNAAGQQTEQAQFNTDGSATEIFYDPSTRDATSANLINADGSQTDYTINADGSQTALSYNAAGRLTSETWFNPAAQETQSDVISGNTTYVDLFSPGSSYAYEEDVYNGNSLSQESMYNQATGQLNEVALFDGSAFANEVEIADGGPYFSEVVTYNSQTGQVLSAITYNPNTGIMTGFSGSGSGSGSSDNSDDDYDDDVAYSGLFSGGYGYYGGYGFAGSASTVQASVGSNIGSIAQADLAKGDQAGATAAEAGLHQAYNTAMATPTAGTGSSVLEGAKWDSNVITWSLAGAPGAGDSQANSAYETDLQQAFATWSAASGITFEELSGSAQSDISVGFGDLSTASTGVVGYTSYQAKNGQMAGANIELEDPNQDALVAGAGGQLTYSGTDATLEQVMLHEIGHAFGLADNADQNSIMYYDLTSNNRTLDSTDIAGIQSLYSPGSNSSSSASNASGSQIDQLIQAMASYAPMPAGITSLAAIQQLNAQPMLAASVH